MRRIGELLLALLAACAGVQGQAWAGTIKSIVPNSGQYDVATTVVVIRGDDFTGAVNVTFNGTLGTAFFLNSSVPGKITVTAPASSLPGGPGVAVLDIVNGLGGSILAATGTFTYLNGNTQVQASARITSIIDISWSVATDNDGDGTVHNAGPGLTSAFVWYVGGVDNSAVAQLDSIYDLVTDYLVEIENKSPAATGSPTVKIGARCSAATTPQAPALTGWALETVVLPPLANDRYAVQAALAGGVPQTLNGASDTDLGVPIPVGPANVKRLNLSYYTPKTISSTSADGFQSATVTLTASRN